MRERAADDGDETLPPVRDGLADRPVVVDDAEARGMDDADPASGAGDGVGERQPATGRPARRTRAFDRVERVPPDEHQRLVGVGEGRGPPAGDRRRARWDEAEQEHREARAPTRARPAWT